MRVHIRIYLSAAGYNGKAPRIAAWLMIEWANLNKLQFFDTDFVSFSTFFIKLHVLYLNSHVLFQILRARFETLLPIDLFSSA